MRLDCLCSSEIAPRDLEGSPLSSSNSSFLSKESLSLSTSRPQGGPASQKWQQPRQIIHLLRPGGIPGNHQGCLSQGGHVPALEAAAFQNPESSRSNQKPKQHALCNPYGLLPESTWSPEIRLGEGREPGKGPHGAAPAGILAPGPPALSVVAPQLPCRSQSPPGLSLLCPAGDPWEAL